VEVVVDEIPDEGDSVVDVEVDTSMFGGLLAKLTDPGTEEVVLIALTLFG
jgi:hypothetical protein